MAGTSGVFVFSFSAGFRWRWDLSPALDKIFRTLQVILIFLPIVASVSLLRGSGVNVVCLG